jgi:hypothetical protein
VNIAIGPDPFDHQATLHADAISARPCRRSQSLYQIMSPRRAANWPARINRRRAIGAALFDAGTIASLSALRE